jgi:hypothetical protein
LAGDAGFSFALSSRKVSSCQLAAGAGFRSLFIAFADAIRVVNTKFPALLVIMLIALAGCDRAKTKQAQTQPHKPASFRDNIFANVTPTADGGAYAIGDSGLWYLRRSQAVKVRFPNLPIVI